MHNIFIRWWRIFEKHWY